MCVPQKDGGNAGKETGDSVISFRLSTSCVVWFVGGMGDSLSLSYLSANQMVIRTFLPTPRPQLLQLVIDVYKML